MKRLLKCNLIILIIGISVLLFACNKEPGEGGTSSIEGSINGIEHDFAESEITHITFSNGNTVEHGDYWLLNSPDVNNYFYIWYDNPSWISDGDPALQGRTGIQVTFDYTDTNVEIATNTMNAIDSATSIYQMQLNNDILYLTCTISGDCPDAEDVTSPFSFDIDNQGKDALLGNAIPLEGEKIYIKYGESEFHNDIEQSSLDGKFRFTGLQTGDYTVFTFSKDTIMGGTSVIEQNIEVSEKGQNYLLEDFIIYF